MAGMSFSQSMFTDLCERMLRLCKLQQGESLVLLSQGQENVEYVDAFMTTERVNPEALVSVSIWATYPALRTLSKAIRWPLALGLACQAFWIERPPPRIALTKYEGLAHASAMTAAAPALMKPAA